MRDTWLLRTRLHNALACLPLAAGLAAAGCGADPAGKPAPAEARVATPDRPATTPATPPTSTPTTPPTSGPVAAADVPASPYPARTGLDPFDPDGMEEEGCPNGDWCGPARAAEKYATQNAERELGCPTRLMGSANPRSKAEEKTYKGLSPNAMMQGRLRKIATTEQRTATGDDDLCCYHWFDYCSGRPLLDDELASVRAPLRAGDTWLTGHVSDDRALALPLAVRRRLAALWLDDARSEHASVAAFARATLELLAVGAPPELVYACQAASLDEVRHARTCFTLAALYAGEGAEPGPLPAIAPRGGGLVALACATFIEGCVGETIAALAALRAGRACQVAPVSGALAGIAEDETRHAELAWATLAFAVHSGGSEVVDAVRSLAAELRTAALAETEAVAPAAPELPADLLAAHGRLGAAALAEARRDAWLDIIGPTLELLLASGPGDVDDVTTPDDLLLS